MDRTINFASVIKQTIDNYVKERPIIDQDVSYKFIADAIEKQFQLVLMGWSNNTRIYHVLFHAEIINDKIWIQEDNTEESLALMLVERGVSKKDIVLGYFSEYHRQHTEYAVA